MMAKTAGKLAISVIYALILAHLYVRAAHFRLDEVWPWLFIAYAALTLQTGFRVRLGTAGIVWLAIYRLVGGYLGLTDTWSSDDIALPWHGLFALPGIALLAGALWASIWRGTSDK